MDFQIEKTSSIERRLTFTVPSGEVTAELEKGFRNLQGKVKLNGFRKGKVPRSVLEQRFGAGLREEVSSNLINRHFREATDSMELFGRPLVKERGELKSGQDFTFTIAVEVRPELELGPYTGVKVDYPVVSVPDARVEADVKARLQGQASLSEVTGRPAQPGDFLLTEIKVSDGDTVVHQHPGTMINTAQELYYTGIEAHLMGSEIGVEKTGEVRFSENAKVTELAGKTLTVTSNVQSIQSMQVPELTDELAQTLGHAGGADEMRASIRARLEESAKAAARNQGRANLLQELIKANEFDAPAGLIDQQLQALLEEVRIQRAYRGEDPRKIQFTDAQMADYRSRARFAAKASLILDHVAKAENLSISDDEIEAKYQEIADARGQQVEAIKGYFVKEDAVDELRKRLLEEKTLDWLLDRAELNEIGGANDNDDATQGEPAAE